MNLNETDDLSISVNNVTLKKIKNLEFNKHIIYYKKDEKLEKKEIGTLFLGIETLKKI